VTVVNNFMNLKNRHEHSEGRILSITILREFDDRGLHFCRFQWRRGIRRGPSAERLLGSWVRIPPEAWIFVSFECSCV
jgi:hypothetical protein